jgi:cyclic pyranopterin phosphate synthase
MPEEEYTWLAHENILEFEEISALIDVFADLGATKVRLTGGEPLLRPNLAALVRLIAQKSKVLDIAMTTNGVVLAEHVQALKEAGLHRITVSVDTLRADRFVGLSRRTAHERVIEGIKSVPRAGFTDIKIDTVVIRGVNEDEIADLIEFGKTIPAEVRFIEYMDVGGATRWSSEKVFSRVEIVESLTRRYGRVEAIPRNDSAPAAQYSLPDGTTFGIVASMTEPFCSSCNRSRLTADGVWYKCLYALEGIDLRASLRSGVSIEELRDLVAHGWAERADRGAEERLSSRERQPLVQLSRLKKDPHLEMHTRGG